MSTIMTNSELKRRAMEFISEQVCEHKKPLCAALEETCVRFNLGPKDAEFLERMFKDTKKEE